VIVLRSTVNFGELRAVLTSGDDCASAAKAGRTITFSAHEAQLARGRANCADPAWQADYKATRPKVERKIGHLMRRRHGCRRARMRNLPKIV
jgi:hypothetical protein